MLLELERVDKEYHATTGTVVALRSVNLLLADNEYVLLEGPSGAGKSTLLHIAGLLDAPTRGTVRFNGQRHDEKKSAALRLANIGFVFQHHYLAPDLTILENVALPALALRGKSNAEKLLERVGLAHLQHRLPRELSGGEQQRAGLARALVNEPKLLLCDEPTGNLDAASADVIAELLAEAHDEGATILVATHDVKRFPQAERKLRIERGQLS